MLVKRAFSHYLNLCHSESGLQFPQTQQLEGEEGARDLASYFHQILNTPNLSTLKVLGFINPESINDFSSVLGGLALNDVYFGEIAQSTFAQRAQLYGVDENTGCIALFEIDGHLYLLCVDTLAHDGQWRLSPTANLTSFMGLPGSLQGLVPLSTMYAVGVVDVDAFMELFLSM